MPLVLSPEMFEKIVGVAAPAAEQAAPTGLALPAGSRLVDRRQAPRIQIGQRVRIRLGEKRYGGAWDTVMLQDISVQGASFVSSDPIAVNDLVELWMKDQADQPVRIRCSVKRCERGGFGGVSYLIGTVFEEILDNTGEEEPQAAAPRRREDSSRAGLAGMFKKLNPAEWFGRNQDDFSTSTTGFKLSEELVKMTEDAEKRASAAKEATGNWRQEGSSLFAKAPSEPGEPAKAEPAAELEIKPPPQVEEAAVQAGPAKEFDFTVEMLPGYLRTPRMVEELIPWLRLRGVADADMAAAATHLGFDSIGLSPQSIGKLRQWWQDEYQQWRTRDLRGKRYAYLWAETPGDEASCVMSLVGATEDGKRELVDLRESSDRGSGSWKNILLELVKRGLIKPPRAAVGQAGMTFWKALTEVSKSTRHQFVWDRELLPAVNAAEPQRRGEAQQKLGDILLASKKEEASEAIEQLARLTPAGPKLLENREGLVALFDFPAEHRDALCSDSPLPASLEAVPLNAGVDDKMVMLFKLAQFAQKNWEPIPAGQAPSTDKKAA